jgi:hypothetical protein
MILRLRTSTRRLMIGRAGTGAESVAGLALCAAVPSTQSNLGVCGRNRLLLAGSRAAMRSALVKLAA